MTSKQYKTAMGKVVDMGAIMMQNENTRAVGNMHVNARGDRLNSNNRVIDNKSQQIKRQNKKQVNPASMPATVSNAALRRSQAQSEPEVTSVDLPEETVELETTAVNEVANDLQGGLAAAIAKAKTVQQTKLSTPKEAAKAAGVRKI